MKVEIKAEKQNALFGRKEVTLAIEGDKATPSRKDVIDAVCKKLSVSADCVAVQKIGQGYGSKKVAAVVHAYPSKEALEKSEPGHFAKRGLPKEKK
ncbi:MAG: hypothetical protein WC792_04755 [Candidatus Micrarchaeia archaeon]|jgi:ribosomal protein S24E